MSKLIKRGKILSSETNTCPHNITQKQNTDINFSIYPPENFQQPGMEELATMPHPSQQIEQDNILLHPALKNQHSVFSLEDGPLLPSLNRETVNPLENDEDSIENPVKLAESKTIVNTKYISQNDTKYIKNSPIEITSPMTEEYERLKYIEVTKQKQITILEELLEVYKNNPVYDKYGNVLCKSDVLLHMIKTITGASKVEILIGEDTGCFPSKHIAKIESIIVTSGGKSYDFKLVYNDLYTEMIKHGINMKKVSL